MKPLTTGVRRVGTPAPAPTITLTPFRYLIIGRDASGFEWTVAGTIALDRAAAEAHARTLNVRAPYDRPGAVYRVEAIYLASQVWQMLETLESSSATHGVLAS